MPFQGNTTSKLSLPHSMGIEQSCLVQAETMAASPAFDGCRVVLMPDAHSGKASVVGFTAETRGRIIPSVVGGDVGCGVLAIPVRRPKKGLDFAKLDKAIRAEIPHGVGVVHADPVESFDYGRILCWGGLPGKNRIPNSLGTLGAGNHFLELDEDCDGSLWLVIHSGSRSLGTAVAKHYQDEAAARIGAEIPECVPYFLAWLDGDAAAAYMHDMSVAADFAAKNRRVMADRVMRACKLKRAGDPIDCRHNYIDAETGILRKGAVDAAFGKEIVMPLNMARGCVLARGRGNAEWNFSAPHGAGRAMTRSQARDEIPMSGYKAAMEGVWSSCVGADTVDESPQAYKEPENVLAASEPTMEIVSELRSIYNFKAPAERGR